MLYKFHLNSLGEKANDSREHSINTANYELTKLVLTMMYS